VESFVAVDGDSYTFNVNPTDGTSVAVTIDVLVNKAIDAAGNNNLASNQLTYTSDTVVPTLTTVIIASNNANTALAKAGDTVTLSFTSSETIQVNPVVAITSGSVAITNAITIANPSGNNWTATNIVNTSDTNGVVAFTINFIDTSGNTGTQVTAVTNGSSVTIDRTAPTLAEVTPVPTPTKDTTPDYTFSSNETGTITYAGGCTSGTTAASSGNNPITYTTLTDGIYGGCTIIVTDATGNASSALDVTDFTVDTVVPVISSLVPSSGATTFDATPTIGANYTDASAGINTSTVVITVDGTNVTAFATINVGDVSYTPASAMTDGIHTVTVNVNDLAGNSAVQASWSFRIASSGVAVTTDVTTVVADNLTQAKITVQVLDVNSDPVTSGNVDFISNIGTITPVTVALNGDGEAVAYIKSSDVGLSTITASFNAESGTTQVTFTLYDGTNPVVSSLAVDTDPAGTGDVLNITFNVNETLISNPAVTVDGNNATFSSVIGLSYRYTYTVTGSETEGNVVVLVSAEDTSSNVGTGSISNLTLDFSVPTFTIIEGTDTGPVQTDTINVTITEDNAITVSKYGFSTDAVCNASDTYGNAFTSGVSFDITGDHADYLCVMATNDSGNTGYQLVGQLNVDNTAPTITTQYPADNSTDVVISVNPYIDFSEAIDGTTLISGNVELRNATSSAVIASTYNISTNGDGTTRLTFIPNSALAYSTQYYFFVDADVEDTASNTFAGNTWEAAQKSSHEFTTIAEDVPVTTYNIALTSGWNLISLPLIPNSTVIGNVLAGISGNVIMVRYYDASSVSWLSYVPGVGGSLTTMEDGKGYWINMNASNTLTVNGVEMPGPEEELPNYSVVEGWNLIGFKSVETKKSSEYLSGLSYIVLYGYNGAYSTIAHPTDIDNNMTPGSGFWAYFSTAGTIIP